MTTLELARSTCGSEARDRARLRANILLAPTARQNPEEARRERSEASLAEASARAISFRMVLVRGDLAQSARRAQSAASSTSSEAPWHELEDYAPGDGVRQPGRGIGAAHQFCCGACQGGVECAAYVDCMQVPA